MGYTNAQLREILRAAGWPESLIPIMAAIGQSESSGDPTSYRNCPGNGYCTVTQGGVTRTVREVPGQGPETSAGLWQVNLRAWPQYSTSWLRDPINSAKAAYEIYKKQGFRAWGSYTDGGYKKYYSGSADTSGSIGVFGGAATPDVSGIGSGSFGDILGLGWVKDYFFEEQLATPMERFQPFIATPAIDAKTRILIATAILVIVIAFTWREF